MKSLKTYIREEENKDFEKNIKKLEKSVGGGVSAAGVFESWVFIVARIKGGKNNIRPTPAEIDIALKDDEFHNKGTAWFEKIGWSSRKDGMTNGKAGQFPVEWIIDAIQEVGKDVKDIPGITWGPSLEIMHEKLGGNYYKKIDKRWKEGESKENTADMVFITKGKKADLTGYLPSANKPDTITWGPDYGDKVQGRLSSEDKSIQWFQVSLKKGEDDARIGKVSAFLQQKYAGFTPKHWELETNSVIKSRGDFLGVSYGWDDLTDQILLDEGLFDAFKGLVKKVKGSIKKLTSWASKKLRKIVGGAVKLARKVMSSNPVIDNANVILDLAKVSAKKLDEEFLVEKTEEPIKFKSDKARKSSIEAWKTLKKQLKSGVINREYKKIQPLINKLNARKADKFKGKKDAVIFKTSSAAELKEDYFVKLVDDIITRLKYEKKDWTKGDLGLSTFHYFLPLKVASHYTAYNAINIILQNLLDNIQEHQHVVDAAKTFVADVKSEAKFGNTRLPLWIVYGHGGSAHYLTSQPLFHAKAEKDIENVELDQPYIVIQVTTSKRTAATYNLEGHNVTQVYLMSGLDSPKEGIARPKYLVLNLTTSSGSRFTMKAEVEKEITKVW